MLLMIFTNFQFWDIILIHFNIIFINVPNFGNASTKTSPFHRGSQKKGCGKNQLLTASPRELTIPKAVEKYVHDYHGATPHRAPPVGVEWKTPTQVVSGSLKTAFFFGNGGMLVCKKTWSQWCHVFLATIKQHPSKLGMIPHPTLKSGHRRFRCI